MKNNWQTKKLSEVTEINPSKKEVSSLSFNTPVSFVSMASINENVGTISNIQTKKLGEVNNGYTYFSERDILLAKITPCMENGKVAIAQNLTNGVGFGTTEVYVIRPNKEVLPEWIYSCINNNSFRDDAKKHMTGSGGQQRVPREYLENTDIPVPPLPVQQQIVKKLDEIKKLQELNEKEIEKAKELFNSFITSQLFSKGGCKSYKFDDISMFQYGLTAEGKDKGAYRFIRITDIDETGQLRNVGKKYVEADRKQVEKYLLKDGDLLVARTGATYGKFIYCEPQEPSVFASYLIKLSFKQELALPRFVWLFTRTGRYWIQAKKLVTGSGQPQFNANRIKELEIPLPSLNKQKEIVTEAEQLLIYSNNLKKEQTILKELFESILNKLIRPN